MTSSKLNNDERQGVSDATLIAITQNSPDYIMILNNNYEIEFINHTVPDLTREQVIGKSIFDFTPPDYHNVSTKCIDHVMQTGEPGIYETKYERADG